MGGGGNLKLLHRYTSRLEGLKADVTHARVLEILGLVDIPTKAFCPPMCISSYAVKVVSIRLVI